MPVTVEPSEFRYVEFDAAEIASMAEDLARTVGLADVPITVEVDETSPLGHTELVSIDPVHIRTQGGAFENPKRIRQLSPEITADVLGRYLRRAADRRSEAFADAPDDDDLEMRQRTAWDVYTVGRLARNGHPVQRQRWLYTFRNRHGFTDESDAAFETLWHADDLTWAQLDQLSADAAAANPGPLER